MYFFYLNEQDTLSSNLRFDVSHFEDDSRKKKKEKETDHMGVSQFSIFLSLYTLEINAITFLRAHVSSKTTRPSRVAGYPHYVFIRDFLWTIGRQEVVAQMHKVRFRSRGIN